MTPRLGSAAALAAFSGTAPIALSSGGRGGHRLNRGGNRRLNSTIRIIALGQRRAEPRAQAYHEKGAGRGQDWSARRCAASSGCLVDVVYLVLDLCQSGQEHGVQGSAEQGIQHTRRGTPCPSCGLPWDVGGRRAAGAGEVGLSGPMSLMLTSSAPVLYWRRPQGRGARPKYEALRASMPGASGVCS